MTTRVVLGCEQLEPTLAFFAELGFRLQAILPADAPRIAVLVGRGLELELRVGALPPGDIAHAPPSLVVSRLADARWQTGRAGMRYRDLIPGRLGGRFVASHIHIPQGGPVADYVHFHQVHLQMIYCWRGWARLVYEDQGPPFLLEPGGCVLQPTTIRHQVLESSDNLEVIELASPAEHWTVADPDLSLPTPTLDPERRWAGQRFVHARSPDLSLAGARLLQAPQPPQAHRDPRFLFVLEGSLHLHAEGHAPQPLQAGDSVTLPPQLAAELAGSHAELLEVLLPS
jgi:quercetin dioxygenase-like cupin family protein